MDNETTSNNVPKLSVPTLELKNNYYVVPDNGLFNYFAIKITDESVDRPIMRLEKSPPIIVDGLMIIKKKIYAVTAGDLFRGIVRKSREIKTEKRDNSGNTGNSTRTEESSGRGTVSDLNGTSVVQNPDQSGTNPIATMEVDQVVNSAWDDQIDALLHSLSSKEGGEWEVEGPA